MTLLANSCENEKKEKFFVLLVNASLWTSLDHVPLDEGGICVLVDLVSLCCVIVQFWIAGLSSWCSCAVCVVCEESCICCFLFFLFSFLLFLSRPGSLVSGEPVAHASALGLE